MHWNSVDQNYILSNHIGVNRPFVKIVLVYFEFSFNEPGLG